MPGDACCWRVSPRQLCAPLPKVDPSLMLEAPAPLEPEAEKKRLDDVVLQVKHLLELVNVEVAGRGGGDPGTGKQAVQGGSGADVTSKSGK